MAYAFCHVVHCIKVLQPNLTLHVPLLQGHGHWVNSLALSTEYVLRTGAFDHTGKHYSSPEEVKKVRSLIP